MTVTMTMTMTVMKRRTLVLQLLLVVSSLLGASVWSSAGDGTTRLRKVEDVGEPTSRVAALWAFGDSLLDAGTNSLFSTLLQADFKPYGQQFGKPTGRFSNGRTYADFVAEYVGLPAVEPYLKKKGKRDSLLGLNYASGGCGLLRTTNAIYGVVPFTDQILQFNQTRLQITQTLKSALAAEDLFSKSLFLINIGINDVFVYLSNASANIPHEEYVDGLVVVLKDSIQALYEAGARKLMIIGAGPLGCNPAVVASAAGTDGKCVEPFNAVVETFNAKLEDLILNINSSFPKLRAVIGKPFAQFRDFVTNDEYGFTAGTTACCGAGAYNGQMQCGRSPNLITNAPFFLCENVDEYVFWDNFHPGEKAVSILSEQFWTGNSSAIAPVNLKTLVSS